jgi:hypothetical protein
LPAFTDAVVAFVEAVDQESPFYPKEIYEALEKLVLIAQRERTDVLVDRERFHGDWYLQGEQNFEQFCDGAQAVSDLIRERISKLSIHRERLE